MNFKTWLPVLFLFSGVLACTTTQTQNAGLLLAGEWQVESMNGIPVAANSAASLKFFADGRLAGPAFCNHYMARYRVAGEELIISPGAVTRKICSPSLMVQQGIFLQIIHNTNRFKILPDGRLFMSGQEDSRLVAHRVTVRQSASQY